MSSKVGRWQHLPQPATRLRHAVGRFTPGSGTIAGAGLGGTTGYQAPLSPRCGKPMTGYETREAIPDKYSAAGQAIRQARLAAGMSQAQLAAAIGAGSRKVISSWELGLKYPRKGARELERVLGIRLDGPVCGRPDGHKGPCRSAEALARYYQADAVRVAEVRRVKGRRYGRRDSGASGWPAAREAA